MAAKPPRHRQGNRRIAASEIWGWLVLRACTQERFGATVEIAGPKATMQP